MTKADEPTYSLAEICAAARVQRATAHSWLSRHYIPVAPGLGMGRERRFTLLDAIRMAVLAELTRLGLMVGVAAAAAQAIMPDLIAPNPPVEGRLGLVLAPSAASADYIPERNLPKAFLRFSQFETVERLLWLRFSDPPPVGFLFLDITAIADRTRSELENPGGEWRATTWLETPERVRARRSRKPATK